MAKPSSPLPSPALSRPLPLRWSLTVPLCTTLLAWALAAAPQAAQAAAATAKAGAPAASAPLPTVNLLVQVRQVDAAEADEDDSAAENRRRRNQGYTVGTQPSGAAAPWQQQAQVLNGQWASLNLAQSQPFQWTRAYGQAAAGTGSQGNTGGSSMVVNEMSWLPSGTAWSVRPEWPGGTAAAKVEIDIRSQALQAGHGQAPLPAVNSQQARSTVMAPLGSWVTVARIGAAPARNSNNGGQTWSTAPAGGAPRVLQIRVSEP